MKEEAGRSWWGRALVSVPFWSLSKNPLVLLTLVCGATKGKESVLRGRGGPAGLEVGTQDRNHSAWAGAGTCREEHIPELGTNWVCKGLRGQQCEGGVSKAVGRTRGLIFEPQTGGQRNRVGEARTTQTTLSAATRARAHGGDGVERLSQGAVNMRTDLWVDLGGYPGMLGFMWVGEGCHSRRCDISTAIPCSRIHTCPGSPGQGQPPGCR